MDFCVFAREFALQTKPLAAADCWIFVTASVGADRLTDWIACRRLWTVRCIQKMGKWE